MWKTIITLFFLTVLLPNFSSALAATSATTILSGGVSIRGNYNINETENDTTYDWSSSANAFLGLTHQRIGEKGGVSLGTSANYSYNFKDNDGKFSDFFLNFKGWRDLTKRLRINISDNFRMTNDLWGEYLSLTATGISDAPPDEGGDNDGGNQEDPDKPELAATIGPEKFWRNYFNTTLSYQYSQRGTATIGYNNTILNYTESDKDSYQRDGGSIRISQGLGPRWSSGVSYSYNDARFDISEDYTYYNAGANLGYTPSVRDSFYVSGNYYEKNYDSIPPDNPDNLYDLYAISGSLGWTHNLSPHKSLSMSAGPSYYRKDNGDEGSTPNFHIIYTSQFEKGSWFVGADGGFTDRSFSGSATEQGVSEYQRAAIGVTWQMTKDLSAGLGSTLRTDNFLENPLQSDKKTYSAYANLSYRFWRWFFVSGRYYFAKDFNSGTYDSTRHRFFITLGASRELYRWQ